MRRFAPFLVLVALLSIAAPAVASEQQELVDRSKILVDRLRRDANLGKAVTDYLGRAKAVLIVPNLWRAGFFFGGSGGSGVLVARAADGSWSAPAFYGVGGGSFGLQIGAEMQELLLFVLTDGGLDKLMDNQAKIGADLTFALGPVGAGFGGATTPNLGADLIAFSSGIGLYGGINLEGGLIATREEWNRVYYGEGATSRQIILNRKFDNPGAADLKAILAAPPPAAPPAPPKS